MVFVTERRLLISFSGGETSAYMTWLILSKYRHLYDVIHIVFANTSQENNETLDFVEWCDTNLFRPLGHAVVWLEAVQHHGKKKSASHRVVHYHTACRDGSVFEDMIKKYGLPNQMFPSCTRDLKLAPINSYVRSLGWTNKDYETAIGIRADEIDRMNEKPADGRTIIYPLIKWEPTRKPQINTWFAGLPRRLNLKGYQGDCKWCWKKTLREHYTLALENPSQFEFPMMMELKYGFLGPEFSKDSDEMRQRIADGYRRTMFRKMSAVDIVQQAARLPADFKRAEDDSVIYDVNLDTSGGCGESCEVFADETLMEFDEHE